MKNKILGLLLFLFIQADAQNDTTTKNNLDTTVDLNILKAPTSPAANFLGIAASDIDKPTTAKDFIVSVRNNTSDFSGLPKSYAIDFAPYYLFSNLRRDLTTQLKPKDVFKKTLMASLGILKVDKIDSITTSINKTQLGFGIKFSLVRGTPSKETTDNLNDISNYQASINDKLSEKILTAKANNKKLLALKEKLDNTNNPEEEDKILKEMKSIQESIKNIPELNIEEDKKAILKKVQKLDFELKGFNLDFAAGGVVDFIENNFDNSRLNKAGVWLTGSYSAEKSNTTFLGIIRYLYNPKSPFADTTFTVNNLNLLDFGGKLNFELLDKKLILSGEGIYRSCLNSSIANPSWKIVFNAEYAIGKNQKLTFSFGRNFNGTTTQGGNLISAINFLVGLGKERIPFQNNNK